MRVSISNKHMINNSLRSPILIGDNESPLITGKMNAGYRKNTMIMERESLFKEEMVVM